VGFQFWLFVLQFPISSFIFLVSSFSQQSAQAILARRADQEFQQRKFQRAQTQRRAAHAVRAVRELLHASMSIAATLKRTARKVNTEA
jgi:hypothetical protein